LASVNTVVLVPFTCTVALATGCAFTAAVTVPVIVDWLQEAEQAKMKTVSSINLHRFSKFHKAVAIVLILMLIVCLRMD
jgi:hypothetical protein